MRCKVAPETVSRFQKSVQAQPFLSRAATDRGLESWVRLKLVFELFLFTFWIRAVHRLLA